MTHAAAGTILILATALCEAQNLMPWPAKVVRGAGSMKIDPGFRIELSGPADLRARAAAQRFEQDLENQTGMPLRKDRPLSAKLLIEYSAAGPEIPAFGHDESYELTVNPQGATLQAREPSGMLPGLQTFLQMIVPGPGGFEIPAITIEDKPRFPWRGLMLDTARHFMPVDVLERNLRAMAAAKLNVLHLHLSDDQGFRVESERFPKLHLDGSDGSYYTRTQVKHIVDYAAERGIRVIPEFDVPGHTTAWLAAYPGLGSAPGPYKIERLWGIFQPTLDPTREETYQFLDQLLNDLTPLFPDRYFHIGGDEVEETQWKQSPSIQSFAKLHGFKTTAELHGYFNTRLQQLLSKHGKTLIGWDEVLQPGLAPGAIIQSWRGQASLADAARLGFQGILSFGYYLDHLRPASYHYGIDPMDAAADRLTAAEASRILGGEACIWSEYTSEETIDSRIWPRLLAIAERLWSPRGVNDPASMYSRLEPVSRWLENTGIRHRSNYLPMLDRIAGVNSAVPVKILADAVESAPIQVRRDTKMYDSFFPLNRLVDAARVESEAVRALELAADHVAAGAGTADEIAGLRRAFVAWREDSARLAALAGPNYLVREVLPLSTALSEVGSIGLAALALRETKPIAEADREALERRLRSVTTDAAEVTLAAVRPVRTLLERNTGRAAPGNGNGNR
jgi:hexosaminidase